MKASRVARALVLTLAMVLAVAAAPRPKTPPSAKPRPAATLPVANRAAEWLPRTRLLASGNFLFGDPAARVRLTEYISYTCPHCARFQRDSAEAMRRAYLGPGKVAVEIRHVVRDPVDHAVAVLARCGDPNQFWRRHDAFLREQDTWIAPLRSSTAPQRRRWAEGPMPARLHAVVDDFNLYPLMERLGVGRAAVDACLADEPLAAWLDSQLDVAIAAGVRSTPSFEIGGAMVDGAHDWSALEPPLKAKL